MVGALPALCPAGAVHWTGARPNGAALTLTFLSVKMKNSGKSNASRQAKKYS